MSKPTDKQNLFKKVPSDVKKQHLFSFLDGKEKARDSLVDQDFKKDIADTRYSATSLIISEFFDTGMDRIRKPLPEEIMLILQSYSKKDAKDPSKRSALTSLDLSFFYNGGRRIIDDKLVQYAIELFPNLTKLNLSNAGISSKALDNIANLQNLQYLNLQDCMYLDGTFIKNLDNLNLTHVNLSKFPGGMEYIGEEDIIHLIEKHPQLKHLEIIRMMGTGKVVPHLNKLTQLETLALPGNINDFSFLADMPKLTRLSLGNPVERIKGCKSREEVEQFMSKLGIEPINEEEKDHKETKKSSSKDKGLDEEDEKEKKSRIKAKKMQEEYDSKISVPFTLSEKEKERLLDIDKDYENKDIDKILPLSLSGHDEVYIANTISTQYGIPASINEDLTVFTSSDNNYESIVIPIHVTDPDPKKGGHFTGVCVTKKGAGYEIIYFDPRGRRDEHFSEVQRKEIEEILKEHGITGKMQVNTNVIQKYNEFEPNNNCGPYVVSILSKLATKDIEAVNGELHFQGTKIHMSREESMDYAKDARKDAVQLLEEERDRLKPKKENKKPDDSVRSPSPTKMANFKNKGRGSGE